MTQFELNVFNFLETIFGKDAAEKIFCFFIQLTASFMYLGYVFTLPFQFMKLFWKNLKEKGVV
jgi:hypothetical protein